MKTRLLVLASFAASACVVVFAFTLWTLSDNRISGRVGHACTLAWPDLLAVGESRPASIGAYDYDLSVCAEGEPLPYVLVSADTSIVRVRGDTLEARSVGSTRVLLLDEPLPVDSLYGPSRLVVVTPRVVEAGG